MCIRDSHAPHHDIYSIEDLRQLVFSLKEATEYKKPVIVKVAAVNNIAAIASGIARSGADIIAIDGFRGGTGAEMCIRDSLLREYLVSLEERNALFGDKPVSYTHLDVYKRQGTFRSFVAPRPS